MFCYFVTCLQRLHSEQHCPQHLIVVYKCRYSEKHFSLHASRIGIGYIKNVAVYFCFCVRPIIPFSIPVKSPEQLHLLSKAFALINARFWDITFLHRVSMKLYQMRRSWRYKLNRWEILGYDRDVHPMASIAALS